MYDFSKMTGSSSWIVAPGLSYKPGGLIAIGNVIKDSLTPQKALIRHNKEEMERGFHR